MQKLSDRKASEAHDTAPPKHKKTNEVVSHLFFSRPVNPDESNVSLVAAAEELGLADNGQHENDGAADDYYGYDLSMSDGK